MLVRFAATRPDGVYVLALPLAAGPITTERPAGIDPSARMLVQRAAESARFEGETAAVVELYVAEGTGVRRLLLVGTGSGPDGYERAGGAVAAKLLTSGETRVVVDLTGLSGDAAARFASGAMLRSWRHDVYRTRLAAKSRPTLNEVVIVGGGSDAEAAWARLEAIAAGVSLTRELVTEPANIIYPESFVERCRHLADLGIGIEVLDEAAMREAGMGSLLSVSAG